MNATTIKTGTVKYLGEEHWVLNSCVNLRRYLYVVLKTKPHPPEFCVGGQWVPETECEWLVQEGGKTISI